MKYYILLILVLTSNVMLSQTEGYVIDRNTNSPISYANIWVEDAEIGTTSDIGGYFHFVENLRNKHLIISSIGYERQRFFIDSAYLKVLLEPKTYLIPEVSIAPRKGKEFKINPFRKWNIYSYISSTLPVIYARFIPYHEEYQNAPFIKSIKIETFSKIESSFCLKILYSNQNSEPGEENLTKNLIIKVKKGKRSNIISNFGESPIILPKEGLFVAVEHLIIEENKYEWKSKNIDTKTLENVSVNMPLFGTVLTKQSSPLWVYTKGKWKLYMGDSYMGKPLHGKNQCIAMEVTIIN